MNSTHFNRFYNNYYGNYYNNAPTTPTFTYLAPLVQGKANAGDILAIAQSQDYEGDAIRYQLLGGTDSFYQLNSTTGVLKLTAAGADAINRGTLLPDIQVIATDGKANSPISAIKFAHSDDTHHDDTPDSHTHDAPSAEPVNHLPDRPIFTEIKETFTQGEAKRGDIVAHIQAHDSDGDNLRYYLSANPGRVYAINSKAGTVYLTDAGAAMVNRGENLPDLKVIANDGHGYSQTATLNVADTTTPAIHQNHTPEMPHLELHNITQGYAHQGDIVATASSHDADGDMLTYHLFGNNGSYQINYYTGEISLTAYGSDRVNQGYRLPDIKVVASDGISASSIAQIAPHIQENIPPITENPIPTPPTPPLPSILLDNQFHVDTTFYDSRDLSQVQLPYFIKMLETNKSGYLHKVWDGYGKGAVITYEFATSAHDSGQGYDFTVKGFKNYSNTQKQAVYDALHLYEEQTNLKFVEKSPWSNAKANFKFYLDDLTVREYANNHLMQGHQNSDEHNNNGYTCNCPVCAALHHASTNGDGAASSFLAGFAYFGGDVHLNSTIYNTDNALSRDTKIIESYNGRYTNWVTGGFGTLIHELGHSVGLAHPFDGNYSIPQNSPEDKTSLTFMSYNQDIKEDIQLSRGGTVNTSVSATNFGVFDLAALHYRYGVNEHQHAGDTTYHFKDFNPSTLGNDIYIWDGSGNDTFDASEETLNLNINLTPGSWIYRGEHTDTLIYDTHGELVGNQMFIGFGTQIENLKGGSGHDILIGNETNNHIEGNAGNDTINGGKGDDLLEGGEGNDILIGGDGHDILIGGAGHDTFVFNSALTADNTDIIRDFSIHDGDILQLDSHIFSTLQKGSLNNSAFSYDTAHDANDHIILSNNTLYYDPDGNGNQQAIAFAQFSNTLDDKLTTSNIEII